MPSNLSAALAYVAREYPGQYEEQDAQVTVGVAPSLVLLPNPERMSVGLVNTGPTNIYISPDSKLSVGNGVMLLAGGGSFTMNVRDDLTLPTLGWYAYSDAANGTLYTVQIYRFAGPAVAAGGTGTTPAAG